MENSLNILNETVSWADEQPVHQQRSQYHDQYPCNLILWLTVWALKQEEVATSISVAKDRRDTFPPEKDPARAHHNPYLKTSGGSNAKPTVKMQEENKGIFFFETSSRVALTGLKTR